MKRVLYCMDGWLRSCNDTTSGRPETVPHHFKLQSHKYLGSSGMEDMHRSCIMIKREFNSQNPAVAPSFVYLSV